MTFLMMMAGATQSRRVEQTRQRRRNPVLPLFIDGFYLSFIQKVCNKESGPVSMEPFYEQLDGLMET